MVAFIPFLSLAVLCVAVQAEPLALVDSKGFPQCGVANFRWTGGVSPFSFTFGTTDNSTVSNAAIAPNLVVHNYTIDSSDLPAGTPYTVTVVDNTGSRQESPVLTVQPSSNSSCLSQATALPPATSTSSSTSKVAPTTSSSSTGAVRTSKASPGTSAGTPHVALIAGVAVAGLAILAVIAAFVLVSQRRRGSRNGYSAKEGWHGPGRAPRSPKVDLDALPADQEIEEMAIPDPYVFRPISRGHTSLAIDADALNRRPTSRTDPAAAAAAAAARAPPSQRSPAQTTTNPKGERFLPRDIHPQQPGSGPSRLQDDDIDRLAARMVAMMSAGRLSDQAWSPNASSGSSRDPDDISAPPPLYHDVARGEGHGGKR